MAVRGKGRAPFIDAKAPIEAFTEAVAHRFVGVYELQFDLELLRPAIQGLDGELRPIVHTNNLGALTLKTQYFLSSGDPRAGDELVRFQVRAMLIP